MMGKDYGDYGTMEWGGDVMGLSKDHCFAAMRNMH